MNSAFSRIFNGVDWVLFIATLPLCAAGLVTIHSFVGTDTFFTRQVLWVLLAFVLFFVASSIDWRFLRRTNVVVALFVASIVALLLLFLLGTRTLGATSRFDLGLFFIQPSDPIKLVLILVLAKYFSRRHVEIAHYRHIIVSGFYTLILFLLLFLQPDFGSAVIVFLVWFGMVLVSGISKKHILLVFVTGAFVFGGLWGFVFQDYQKDRIRTFLNPLTDLQGAGYNAFQSTIAVGSGQFLGKGVGYGTQSRLEFLPEYETDFIFAAFSEEWGFVGVVILFMLYGLVVWRIVREAEHGESNFETLFALGLAILFVSHFIVHVGMNIGLLPVTGITMPFMSYGGSHLAMEFVGLGILMGMRGYRRITQPHKLRGEFVGPQ
ncbi:rod shape-determining protein RodA [Candidatus Wolfebacteria bacterium]|nr:rod shape-determining protein RodA [Candidatus Wolfebacteria bacterium]